MVCVTVHVNLYILKFISMYLYRTSFKNCLLKLFFSQFYGNVVQ